MKIVICGSMAAARDMMLAKLTLEEKGHECILPRNTEQYVSGEMQDEGGSEGAKKKIANDLIRDYYAIISDKKTDAILAVNSIVKRGIPHYIGGNTFLEMGFAHIAHKKIFLLYEWSKKQKVIGQEIEAFQPIILFGNYDELEKWDKLQVDQGLTQLAIKDGIYRCSNDGQTIYRIKGQRIMPCSCGRGKWEYREEENKASPIS